MVDIKIKVILFFSDDKNRVILDIDADGSDYINASFIDVSYLIVTILYKLRLLTLNRAIEDVKSILLRKVQSLRVQLIFGVWFYNTISE